MQPQTPKSSAKFRNAETASNPICRRMHDYTLLRPVWYGALPGALHIYTPAYKIYTRGAHLCCAGINLCKAHAVAALRNYL